MEKIIFTNSKGEYVTLGIKKPFILTKIEGVGGSETDVQMQKAPYQDGQTYIDTLLDPRNINMEVSIMTDSQEELFEKRSQLVRVFNAKLGPGILRYEYDGGVKEIEAVIDQAPIFPTGIENKSEGYQKTIFSLVCPSPFWLDPSIETEEMADWIGGLAFPLMLPMMFSGRSSRQNKIIHNAGNVDTPILFEFSGPATNPKVINADSGEFIKINKVLEENELLIVNTAFGNKKVTLRDIITGIETNAFGYIDLESTFFQLSPGNNMMSYDADAGRENARVKITWRNRYVGV